MRRMPLVAWTVTGLLILCGASVAQTTQSQTAFDDHQNMLEQLGIRALRPGANPNDQSTFSEEAANRYAHTLPEVLRLRDGTRVTNATQWAMRRAEILEDFEREVYGRIPPNTPKVTWDVAETTRGTSGGVPTITRVLVGRVDNFTHAALSVHIEARLTVPADAKKSVPVMVLFQAPARRAASGPATRRAPAGQPWTDQAIAKGWGYATINPTSIQPDDNRLTSGIIGLTNRGQPRTPDQWGALRAWQWGASRLIDCLEQHPEWNTDATKVGIAGLSRYGKAAIVTQAFDPRVAVALVGSAGEGGTKLHRHIFGEAVENLASAAEYHWMAGNFIKYGASDPPMTAADLPVDSHQLIAACAPRPCFISHGIVERGDAKWIDARGSFMAAVLASPVYELLGARGLRTPGDYLTDPMPPVGQLIGGQLAWRQHEGGHELGPNWPAFFEWVAQYIEPTR